MQSKLASQPSIQQVIRIGPVHNSLPQTLHPNFAVEEQKIRLHTGNEVLEVNPKDFGRLYSIGAQKWASLRFPEMYEVPDDDYPPIQKLPQ